MYTLQNFYQSKSWIKLTKILKSERADENGNIICEYCKKPIIHKYDCICHHNTYLNDFNVNDSEVSLNPDNISLVHHRCHNLIHCKYQRKDKKVYLVYGSPLSGKTTYVLTNKYKGDLIVDIDYIWKCISGEDMYIKPYQLKPLVYKIRDLLIDGIKYRLGDWNNAYVVGGYPLQSERERLIKELCAEEVFINTSKEKCVERLKNSKRDYNTWITAINNWFDVYNANKY